MEIKQAEWNDEVPAWFKSKVKPHGIEHRYHLPFKNIIQDDAPYIVAAINANEEKNQSANSILVIELYDNRIRHEGCKALLKNPWINLQQLSLKSNYLGPKACLYLAKAQLRDLVQLNLCKYLFIRRQQDRSKRVPVSFESLLGEALESEHGKKRDQGTGVPVTGKMLMEKPEIAVLLQRGWHLVFNDIGIIGYRFLKNMKWQTICENIFRQDEQS